MTDPTRATTLRASIAHFTTPRIASTLAVSLAVACASAPTPSTTPTAVAAATPPASAASAAPSGSARPKWIDASPPSSDRLGVLAPGTGIPVGQKIPDVTLHDLDGREVALSSLYAKGTVLLAFYRGGWCPFCNAEIRAFSVGYPEYQKRGITPVAISVDKPESEAKTKALYDIPFPVLSDSDAKAIEAFHVVHKVEPAELDKLKGYGIDLEAYSGKAHHEIATPAFFLVDRSGVVQWAHSDPDFKVRPSTAQLLAAIDGVKLGGH